jgi:hypothetical protein
MRAFGTGPIEVQLPAGWTARPLSDRGILVSDPRVPGWELEIAGERLRTPTTQPKPETVGRMAERSQAALLSSLRGTAVIRDGEGGEKIVIHDFQAPGDGRVRQVRAWHRITIRGSGYVIANFNYLVDRAIAERPDLVGIRDLIERQALSAVVRP